MIPSSERRVRGRARRAALALVVGSIALSATTTLAQPTTAPITDPKEMARRLGEEALALYGRGQFAPAYEAFDRAERIAHSPVFRLWMARSKRAIGELSAAKKIYADIVDEALPAGASANWSRAQADATTELAALRDRIPKIEVRLAPGAPSDAQVAIDGAPVRAGEGVDLDPGSHVVRAHASGHATIERTVILQEGKPTEIVTIAFTSSAAPPSAGPPPPLERTRGSRVPGGVVLGVGAAGIAVGAATGIAALAMAARVKSRCVGDQCMKADQGTANEADTLARTSTGAFIAGGALAVAGVVLLVVRPGSARTPSPVSLHVGPTSARFAISF